jgi:hypothetical protein
MTYLYKLCPVAVTFDIYEKDFVGISDIAWVLLHSCQQDVQPWGHVLLRSLPFVEILIIISNDSDRGCKNENQQ